MELPKDIEITNLAESVWNNAAKDLQTELASRSKLIDKLNALREAHEKETKEHIRFKRIALKSMVDIQKTQSINVYDTNNNKIVPPRTNAWNQGDYRKIREPAPKKRKKKTNSSSSSQAGAGVGNNSNGKIKRKRKNSATTNLGK